MATSQCNHLKGDYLSLTDPLLQLHGCCYADYKLAKLHDEQQGLLQAYSGGWGHVC